MTAVTSHAEFAPKCPEGRWARALSNRNGVDLFDNGVFAVGLIGCDRVQVLSSDGGEEGVEAVRVKECRLPVNV